MLLCTVREVERLLCALVHIDKIDAACSLSVCMVAFWMKGNNGHDLI